MRGAGAARLVGVDVPPARLDTARPGEAEFHLGVAFVEASAEDNEDDPGTRRKVGDGPAGRA